jgi:hypothetical protein
LDEQELGAERLADPASRKIIDGCWRSVGAGARVRSLLTQPSVLARAADGLLSPREQQLILRPKESAAAWAAHDLPLIDEAESLLKGGTRQFEHVVVDKARGTSRRDAAADVGAAGPARSMTVLGDRAGNRPRVTRELGGDVEHLGRPTAETAELTMGYRLPARLRLRTGFARARRRASRRSIGAPTATDPTCIA